MRRTFLRLLQPTVRGALVGTAAVLCAGIAYAWTGPLSSAPNCTSGNPGCDAPLNVSANPQTKNGSLIVDASNNAVTGYSTTGNWGGAFYGTSGGVYGESDANSSGTSYYGVEGVSNGAGGVGVVGYATKNWGGAFYGGPGGVYGSGTSQGVEGQSATGYGVYGLNLNNDNWAGYFAGGGGVYAQGSNSSGTCWAWLGYYNNYTLNGNCAISTTGTYTGSAYYYSSDERLKKDIAPLDDSLGKVLALEPVTYEWKDPTRGTGTQLGFIAQQVQLVVPEIVTTDPSTTYMAVDYARVTPLLVGAVQAQEQKIDAQQQQLDQQQKEIDALTAEVEALKAER